MTQIGRLLALLREAVSSSRAQPVGSLLTIILIAAICVTVLLTTGRSAGAQASVLRTIDSEGTRSIVVRAEPGSGLDTSVLDRLAMLDGISWVGAFGQAADARNADIDGSARVPVRLAWGAGLETFGVAESPADPFYSAWATPIALEQLGMPEAAGGIATEDGTDYGVVGRITVPSFLDFLEPLVVVPRPPAMDAPAQLSVLVVIAQTPDQVGPVANAVTSVLGVYDPTKVTVATSEQLALLRGAVDDELGTLGRTLVVTVFALVGCLVSVIMYGLVTIRRKDFGRRRALGASQGLIIALLLTQNAILSLMGAALGSVTAALLLAVTASPIPPLVFFSSLALLAVVIGVVAGVLPAVTAARREPITELRVP